MAWSPGPSPDSGLGPTHSPPGSPGQLARLRHRGSGGQRGARSGRGPRAWPGGRQGRRRCLGERAAAAAAARASGRCVRACWGAGSAAAAAAAAAQPAAAAAAARLERPRRKPAAAGGAAGTARSAEPAGTGNEVIPSGNPEPGVSGAGRARPYPIPGAAAAAPAAAGRERHCAPDRPGIPAPGSTPPLPRLAQVPRPTTAPARRPPAANRSCGRVPIAKAPALSRPGRSARSRAP